MTKNLTRNPLRLRRDGPRALRAAVLAVLATAVPASTESCRAEAPPASSVTNAAETRLTDVAARIRSVELSTERAWDVMARITSVGPRLTGSPEAASAVSLTADMMREYGLENVRTEPVTVGHWVRGTPEKCRLAGPAASPAAGFAVCALGGSVATPPGGLTAPVVEVRTWDELNRLGRAGVAGKIVFFNRPMDRTAPNPFAAYGGAADQRVKGASEAARLGAVAALVRSMTFRVDAHPHTGLMSYAPDAPRIPAAAIATRDADALSARLRGEGEVRLFLEMGCRTMEPVVSANVLGEIRGSERPEEVVVVGGHLDSWDLSAGAHDDGAGCAMALEALRVIRELGLRPKRTLRAVMFMDEENGGTGGVAYAGAPGRAGERTIAAIEQDHGAFVPVALAAGANGGPEVLERVRRRAALFEPLGIFRFVPGGGGVDVGPLAAAKAVFGAVLPSSERYFDVHHSALDTPESVHPRELALGAAAVATLAWVWADEGL